MAASESTGSDLATGFASHDGRFEDVLGDAPSLVRVVDVDAHEGPVYAADEDALYFTTLRRRFVAIKRLALADGTVSVVREDANTANGMALDHEGHLLVCEQGTHSAPARISRLDRHTGAVEPLVDSYEGRPLSSPNDIVVQRDGTIWFTDPSYGFLQGFRPAPQLADALYRYDPQADELTIAASGFDKPNGLAFSPDEKVLYVADNGEPHHLLAYDVTSEGALAARRVLAVSTPEHPDGLAVDAEGRIYASAASGIHVLEPDGKLIGEIYLPGAVNFTFGSSDRNVLFITADTAVWAARLGTEGA